MEKTNNVSRNIDLVCWFCYIGLYICFVDVLSTIYVLKGDDTYLF